jgi:hypothetical protein
MTFNCHHPVIIARQYRTMQIENANKSNRVESLHTGRASVEAARTRQTTQGQE